MHQRRARAALSCKLRACMSRSFVAPLALGLVVAQAAWLTPHSAFAAGEVEAVQVLALQSDDAVSEAQTLTLALKNAAEHLPSVELVSGDYSLEVLSLALGCPDTPDQPCLERIAHKIGAQTFVWGTLQKRAGKLYLKLNLYRHGEPGRAVELGFEPQVEAADAGAKVADRALSQLLSVDAAHAGALENSSDGAAETAGARALSPAQPRLSPRSSEPEHQAAASSNAGAAWTAIAVGGALGAAGLYSTLRVNSINHDPDYERYRAGVVKSADACREADRGWVVAGAAPPGHISHLCSESKTFEALQYVFFGLGAVATGTGALILLTDPKPKLAQRTAQARSRAHVPELEPAFTLAPHAAQFELRARF